MQEYICFEVIIREKGCTFVVLYRSPSQNQDQFDQFDSDFSDHLTLDNYVHSNPFLLLVIGDLNAKSKNWYPLDKIPYDINKIDTITSHFGFHQLIIELTQKSSSFIAKRYLITENVSQKQKQHRSN